MVRQTVADRAFLPAKNLLEEVGDMMILTGKTIVSALRPPYPYGGEFVSQFLFALRLCWFPLLDLDGRHRLRRAGPAGGELPRRSSARSTASAASSCSPSIREFAPVRRPRSSLAGVAGTAITADLGARKIREELDALQVLGVDPVKNLVVPRFLALMLVTGLFDIYALLFGIFGGILADARQRRSRSARSGRRFFANASTTDLWGSVLKTHDLRRDHRDRLLLQGHDRLRRRRGRRARGQPGGRASPSSASSPSTTSSRRRCSPPIPRSW